MHYTNALWWLHAYAFGWELFFQSLWITLQLKLDLSFYWYGIFVPSYLYLAFLCCWVLWIMLMRTQHHLNHSNVFEGLPTRVTVQQGDRKSVVSVPEAYDTGTSSAVGGALYQHSTAQQNYTPDEILAGLHEPDCVRRFDESPSAYFVRRNLTWSNAVRVQLVASAVVALVLVIVRLENPTSSYPWWVFWLVLTIMGGVLAVVATLGAFAQPAYALWMRILRNRAMQPGSSMDGSAMLNVADAHHIQADLSMEEDATSYDAMAVPGSMYQPNMGDE